MINDLVPTTAIIFAFFAQIGTVFGSRSSHGDRYDLLTLRDSLSSTANLHLNWTGPPCQNDRSHWFGITCTGSHVVGISLTRIQLTGSLPPAAFQNLTYLANLSLGNNALRGSLPTLRGLQQLRTVSFSGNQFTGVIPVEYASLPNLSRLELDDNLLGGTIPPFEQDSLTALNVSYNFLHGRVPETSVLRRFSNSSYRHNLGLCGKILDEPCAAAAPRPLPGAEGFGLWSLVLVAVCAVVVTVVVISCFRLLHMRYHKKTREAADYSGEVSSDLVMNKVGVFLAGRQGREKFTLEFMDKERASFDLESLLGSSAEVIEKGVLGSAYRIKLDSGAEVVVKRLNDIGGLSRKDFFQKMQLLGKLRHDNLVAITAFYYSENEKFVVYENLPGCSLFQLIHENRGEGRVPLKWAARLSIAKGIVRGLAYLHISLPSHKVPHGNLKSSNVTVVRSGDSYHPKLTHFGFLPLLPSPHHAHKLAVGKTPEFSRRRKLARESDFYCLGLILLEIITGRVPMEEEDSTQWVQSVAKNVPLIDLLDLELVADQDGHQGMLKLVEIAFDCTALEPQRRPKLTELVERIEAI